MTKEKKSKSKEPLGGLHRAMPIILLAFGVFLGICFITQDQTGMLGGIISDALLGLFSIGAYFIPFLIAVHALFYGSDVKERRMLTRVIFSLVTVFAISSLTHAIANWNTEVLTFDVSLFYNDGTLGVGGGFVGGVIAYAIMSLFGRVGVVIISVLVFIMYIVYFFSKGPALANIGRSALYGIISAFAWIEKKFKRIFSSAKNKKEKKANARAAARNEELLDDEFFGVKGGMEHLEIPELGIVENRSRESIEANLSLHEKVHHTTDTPRSSTRSSAPREDKHDSIKVNAEPVSKHHRTVYDDIGDFGFSADELDKEPLTVVVDSDPAPAYTTSRVDPVASDSADDIFAKDFDPYSISESEVLASKPSSRSLLDDMPDKKRPTVIDSIDDLTEEEMERRKRNAAFEERKRALKNAAHASAPVREAPAPAPKAEPTAPAGNSTSECYSPFGFGKYPTDEPSRPQYAPKTEAPKTEYAPASERRETPTKTVEFHVQSDGSSTPREIKEEHSVTITIEKCEPPSHEAPETNYTDLAFGKESVYDTVYGRTETPTYGYEPKVEPAAPTYTYEPKAEPAAPTYTYEPKAEPAATSPAYETEDELEATYEPIEEPKSTPTVMFFDDEEPEAPADKAPDPEASFKEYSVPEEDKEPEGLVFEFNGEEISSPQKTLTVERTKLDGALAVEEDAPISIELGDPVEDEDPEEDEIPDGESPEEDEEWDDEEIPPEKQNPYVLEARNRFDMFGRDSARDEAPEEPEAQETAPESVVEADSENEYDDGENEYDEPDDENEYDESDGENEYDEPEEDDAPPFDMPKEAPRAEPKQAPVEKKASKKIDYSKYQFPPIDILGLEEGADEDQIAKEIDDNTKTLIETLESFNVTASIKGVDRGPRVTRYEVVPARGVKVNQVTHLFDDIRLALAAEGVRMEAPIPGRSAIGFEIPNKKPVNVRLRELIECEEFKSHKSTSYVCLGKDVAGNPIFGDVAKFPHALVAGATGMGKSVCINSILISMLYKARPDQVRFILIDPKKVEFKVYSGIPHLLIPVVTEAKQAAGALMWAVEEMERRYDLIEQHNVRNIGAYNEKVSKDPSIGEFMPKIVIVIDELNDLMMQVRDPVEDLIMRIAQKARAAGIHLIIGTQRPDVKVITGTIKANINTRISCKVGQIVDSRTVLDMAGAEKLLDKGDMLFKPPDRTQPVRVQGCFVSDSEVEEIMEFLRNQTDGSLYDDEVLAEINKAAQKCGNQKKGGGAAAADDDDDGDNTCGYYNEPQFLDAVDLAIRSHKVSTALLQRKLRIGFGKAARFIDAMEELGIVSEPNGMKPRDVLITMDEWHEKLSRVSLD